MQSSVVEIVRITINYLGALGCADNTIKLRVRTNFDGLRFAII
jgi:hypothetical protein